MTGPHFDTENAASAETRPISVAELLAKNGTIGSPPVTGRRRRRRGNSDAVTVAELTGEIPVIDPDADEPPPGPGLRGSGSHAQRPNGSAGVVETGRPAPESAPDDRLETVNWSEPGPRWPESPPQASTTSGPQRSAYPRPMRRADRSGAEQMSPDPVDDYTDLEVDVMDTDVRDPEPPTEDSAYVRSYLRGPRTLFGKRRTADAPAVDEGLTELEEPPDSEAGRAELDDDHGDIEADLVDETPEAPPESTGAALLRGGAVVLQSMLAVAFGAGLFIGFDQLWRWNSIVALVLAVLVILGLVAAVQVVRKTVDTASTLIAVAVGALIAFGPLALLQSG